MLCGVQVRVTVNRTLQGYQQGVMVLTGLQESTGAQEQLESALQHTQQLELQLADQQSQATETLQAAEEVCLPSLESARS